MGKKIKLIGVPLQYGAVRCGIEYGINSLEERHPQYKGNIDAIEIIQQKEDFSRKNLKFLNTISKACNDLANKIKKTVEDGDLPITMGGDHAIAMGSIAGVSSSKKIGVLWVDAHRDFNTEETSESGNIHGMPLAASCGYGEKVLVDCHHVGVKVDPSNTVLFGIREDDQVEEDLVNEAGVRCYKYSEIEERGFDVCLAEASSILAKSGYDIHMSFDLDSVDPREITGVSTPVKKGITREEGKQIFKYMFDKHNISSVDIVEYNPLLEKGKETADYVDDLIRTIAELSA